MRTLLSLRLSLIMFMSAAIAAWVGISTCAADTTSARECLDQATAATQTIELAGDQSAARRDIATVLAAIDARAAINVAASIRRPSDTARALGAAIQALSGSDITAAREAATAAGRLLLRISSPDQRATEQRLFLSEIAVLGADAISAASAMPAASALSATPDMPATPALPVTPDLPAQESWLVILLSRARSDPAGALALLSSSPLTGAAADSVLAAIASAMVERDPEQALRAADNIISVTLREQTLWKIAEYQPPAEASDIVQRVQDPLIRSAIIASAAIRARSTDIDAALAGLREISIAPDSGVAQFAVNLASTDETRAIALARELPALARTWALGRIAILLAENKPERSEQILQEIGSQPEILYLALARMATTDLERAVRLARALPKGPSREAALASLALILARSRESAGGINLYDVLWEIDDNRWRTRAVAAAVASVAEHDVDAATSLIGLVSEPNIAGRLRAEVAGLIAAKDPNTAVQLLSSLPASAYKTEAFLLVARALLSAGRPWQDTLRLSNPGMNKNLALRWLLPAISRSQTVSPITLSLAISDPYLQAIGLVDAARELLVPENNPALGRKPRAAPGLARRIRIIVEWEGI